MLGRVVRQSRKDVSRRCLMTQPHMLWQGRNMPPIFLDPPSQKDRDFGDLIRSKAAEKGVDLDNADCRMFQIKQENFEFDNPAVPTEKSTSWQYLWGNILVRRSILLDTLQKDDEYLRPFLEKTVEEYRRKLSIHYPKLDWESHKAHAMKSDEGEFARLYREAKAEALASFMKNDLEGYLALYKNDSFITNFDEGDDFGYNIPASLQSKLEGLMKFEWDQTSSNPDTAPYVKLINELSSYVDPKLKNLDVSVNNVFIEYVNEHMSSGTGTLNDVVDVLETTSSSMVGEMPVNLNKKLDAVFQNLKSDKNENRMVEVLRGRGSSSETASLKGKSDSELLTHFADVDESRVDLLVKAGNACKFLKTVNGGQIVVSGLLNNFPKAFTQFFTTESNSGTFMSSNGGAFDNAVSGVVAQKKSAVALGTGLDGLGKAVEQWMQTSLTLDKPSMTQALEQLPSVIESSGSSCEPWYIRHLKQSAQEAKGLEQVELQTLSEVFNNATGLIGVELYERVTNPKSKYSTKSSYGLRAVATAINDDSFNDSMANNLAANLLNAGAVTPAQSELVKSKVGSLPALKELKKAAKEVVDAT
eukprot:UN29496